jgi:hypothetical protein
VNNNNGIESRVNIIVYVHYNVACVLTAFKGLLCSTFLSLTVDMSCKTSHIRTMRVWCLSEITCKSDGRFLCNSVTSSSRRHFSVIIVSSLAR